MSFSGKTAITTFKLIQNANVGGVLESSGNFHLLSRKLGLDAGSSALSLPEMLFRTWGRKMNREASVPRGRVRGRLVQNESTFQSDLSRLKTLTLARARRLGAEKPLPKKNSGCLSSSRAGGKSESRSCHPTRPIFLSRP